eukprot:6425741-Prymnesium_polylepis.1
MHVGVPEIESGTAGCVQSLGVTSKRSYLALGTHSTAMQWPHPRHRHSGIDPQLARVMYHPTNEVIEV